jgi:transcriptional regulator with XRE-family HTH domain
MILADKIINLRKKNGWSQEELAHKLGVSRQSISKYEGAQAVPDLDKILKLSQIFGVTTDYLIKDEMEEEIYTGEDSYEEDEPQYKVTMEMASEFLQIRKEAAKRIAFATWLCVISPICLIVLGRSGSVWNRRRLCRWSWYVCDVHTGWNCGCNFCMYRYETEEI